VLPVFIAIGSLHVSKPDQFPERLNNLISRDADPVPLGQTVPIQFDVP
jgi:hypothetical protein